MTVGFHDWGVPLVLATLGVVAYVYARWLSWRYDRELEKEKRHADE